MLRLIHSGLLLSCSLAALSALALTASLVYTTEPTQFEWRAVSGEEAMTDEAGPVLASEPACDPIILAQAPIAFASIGDFATEAVLAINSYDYLSWDQALPDTLNTYFTPRAARDYYGKFSRSELLSTVTGSYYTVSAISIRPAMVVASSEVDDVRSWTVQVPVTVRYQTGVTRADGGNTVQSQDEVFIVTVLEQRPNPKNYRGVAINDISTEGIRVVDDLDRLEAEL